MSNDFDLTDSPDDGPEHVTVTVPDRGPESDATDAIRMYCHGIIDTAEARAAVAEKLEGDPDEGELVGFRTCPECGELFIGYRDTPCEDCQDD